MLRKILSATLLAVSLHQFCGAMKDNSKASDVTECKFSPIMQNPEALLPYAKALQLIRTTLKDSVKKFNLLGCMYDGLIFREAPDKEHLRTPQYIFLVTAVCNGVEWPYRREEVIEFLCTPCGKIELLCGALTGEACIAISKEFLFAMQWCLEDVTSRVMFYDYIQEDNKLITSTGLCSGRLAQSSWQQNKIYLVKSGGPIDFCSQRMLDEKLIIFEDCLITAKQWETDDVLWKKAVKNFLNDDC